jgi:hypothetical protein
MEKGAEPDPARQRPACAPWAMLAATRIRHSPGGGTSRYDRRNDSRRVGATLAASTLAEWRRTELARAPSARAMHS